MARLPFLGGESGPFTASVIYLLLFVVVMHDVLMTRKVHPATVFGVITVVGTSFIGNVIATTETGRALVRWLA